MQMAKRTLHTVHYNDHGIIMLTVSCCIQRVLVCILHVLFGYLVKTIVSIFIKLMN